MTTVFTGARRDVACSLTSRQGHGQMSASCRNEEHDIVAEQQVDRRCDVVAKQQVNRRCDVVAEQQVDRRNSGTSSSYIIPTVRPGSAFVCGGD